MKQNLPLFRNVSAGEKVCAIIGHRWAEGFVSACIRQVCHQQAVLKCLRKAPPTPQVKCPLVQVKRTVQMSPPWRWASQVTPKKAMRKDAGIENFVQTQMFGGCAADTAVTEMVRSLGGDHAEGTH